MYGNKLIIGYVFVLGVVCLTLWFMLVSDGRAVEEFNKFDYTVAGYGFVSGIGIYFWMLFHFLRNIGSVNRKALWSMLFLFGVYFGATIYFFLVWRKSNTNQVVRLSNTSQ